VYQIKVEKHAVKELQQIEGTDRNRILEAIAALAANPRPPGCRKLKGRPAWRIRIGDYRVVYLVENERLLVLVVKIGHRRDVYEER
jgi:mRNA interferase RelE/StbE